MCTICMAIRFSPAECDYGGSPAPSVAAGTLLTEGADAAASIWTSYDIAPGDSFAGALGSGDSADWVRVTLEAGTRYEISLTGDTLSDPLLTLHDSTGTLIASDDDSGAGLDSLLVFEPVTSGTYYIGAGAYSAMDTGSYTLRLDAMPSTELGSSLGTGTVDDLAGFLREGYWQAQGGGAQQFDTRASNQILVDTSALTAAGQQLAQWAFEAWEAVADLDFVHALTGQTPHITFDDDQAGAWASFSTLNGWITRADVNVSTNWINSYGTQIGSYSLQTYIHEIGHALGLGHQGAYNGSATYPGSATFTNDSWQMSVMSYFSQTENTSVTASFAWLVMPMLADIVAIQQMYGAAGPGALGSGDTTYGGPGHSLGGTWLGEIFDDGANFSGGPVAFTLFDAGGYDVLDLSEGIHAVSVDLRPEAISDIDGRTGALIIARDTLIEELRGTAQGDWLHGNATDNRLVGGAGADTLEGGGGNDLLVGGDPAALSNTAGNTTFRGGAGEDTVSYEGSFGSLRVDLLFPEVNTFAAAGDTYDSIEHLTGSRGSDNLRGTGGDNTLRGEANVDYLFGRQGNDTLEGGLGDDVLLGGPGADALIGGANRDRAQYSESLDGLVADLGDPARNTGEAAGDSYDSIEDLAGGHGADALYGDAGDNFIAGRQGADLLVGGAGHDSLNGGGGADTLEGGAGDDVLRGGATADTFVFDGGADVVEDYNYDVLSFDRNLWGGADLDPFAIRDFARVIGSDTVFDFAGGNTLTLLGYTSPVSTALIEDF